MMDENEEGREGARSSSSSRRTSKSKERRFVIYLAMVDGWMIINIRVTCERRRSHKVTMTHAILFYGV
jgi:hypothetical protein